MTLRNSARLTVAVVLSLLMVAAVLASQPRLSADAQDDGAFGGECSYASARLVGWLWGDGSYNEDDDDFFFRNRDRRLAAHFRAVIEFGGLEYTSGESDAGHITFSVKLPGYDDTLFESDPFADPLVVCEPVPFLTSVIEGEGSVGGKLFDDPKLTRRQAVKELAARAGIATFDVRFQSVNAEPADWPKLRDFPFVACGRIPGGTDSCVLGQTPPLEAVNTVTVDPETVDPETVDPETVDPETVDPETVDPETVDPETVDPVTVDPETADPVTVDPVTVDPVTVDPVTVDPVTVDPETADDLGVCNGLPVTINMNTPGVSGIGTEGDDVIMGTDGPDIISSLGGNDTVCSLDGVDWIDLGAGDDTAFAGLGTDVVWGRTGRDTIHGEGGADYIWGGSAADTIWAGSGADRVFGEDGPDTLNGMGGQDFMWGGEGDDDMQGNWQSDQMWGGPGNDTMRGAEGKDMLYGEEGNDDLAGGDNSDWLDGGPGTDTANGQVGRENPINDGVQGCIAETTFEC